MVSMATDDIIADIDPPEMDEEKALLKRFDTARTNIDRLMKVVVKASERSDPETLSRGLVRLAAENAQLSVEGSGLQYYANMASHSADNTRHELRLEYLNAKHTVAKAETQAKVDTALLDRAFLEVQALADEAISLSRRVDTVLKMGQSRLSLIKDEIRN